MKIGSKPKQHLGKEYVFKCGHKTILPNNLEEINSDIIWNIKKGVKRNGCWTCRICHNIKYKESLIGANDKAIFVKARRLLSNAKALAKSRNFAPIDISPVELLEAWKNQHGFCKSCGRCINWYLKNNCCIDHNHLTGEFRGFLCRNCNCAEGYLKDYSDKEIKRFLNYRKNCRGN